MDDPTLMDLAMSGTAPWRSQCRAAGGFATVFPTGSPFAGLPACRTQDAEGVHYHLVAPVSDYVQLRIANGWDRLVAEAEGRAAAASLDMLGAVKKLTLTPVLWALGLVAVLALVPALTQERRRGR